MKKKSSKNIVSILTQIKPKIYFIHLSFMSYLISVHCG